MNIVYGEDVSPFSEAKALKMTPGANRVDQLFVGNFFPDMAAWDKLVPHPTRGAGGTTLRFRSRTGKNGHMSVLPPQRSLASSGFNASVYSVRTFWATLTTSSTCPTAPLPSR